MRLPFFRATDQVVSVIKSEDKGKVINLGSGTIVAGGNVQADLDVTGYSTLIVLARIGNGTTPATAAGDISYSVVAYEDDGVTLFPAGQVLGINADLALRAASLSGNVAWKADRYSLGGIDKVRVALVNNNVAPLQGGTVIYYLQA